MVHELTDILHTEYLSEKSKKAEEISIMASAYVEEYAKRRGITVAEAMEHYIVKEYLKYHPDDSPKENQMTETKIVAGCGCAAEG